MKIIILSIVLFLCCHFAQSQNKTSFLRKMNVDLVLRHAPTLRASSSIDDNSEDLEGNYKNFVRLFVGYSINKHWNLNIGTGANGETHAIALLLNVKYRPTDRLKGLFLMAEGGSLIDPGRRSSSGSFFGREDKDNGYTYLFGVGYKFVISKLLSLNITYGYNVQKLVDHKKENTLFFVPDGYDTQARRTYNSLPDKYNETYKGFVLGAGISFNL